MKNEWGLGLELERMVFYKKKDEYYAVDIQKLFKEKKKAELLEEETDLLKQLPLLELAGRDCIVLIKSRMFEIVTTFPFNNKIEDVVQELERNSKKLLFIFTKIYNTLYKTKRTLVYSPISALQYIDVDNKKKFSNTGSLHVNITLPFTEKTGKDQFLKQYQSYIHQFHWLEPILYSVLTSGNYRSITSDKYVKCCYRSSIGWGVPGGTDIRRLAKGQPRMISILPNYLEDVKFKKFISEKNKECYNSRITYDAWANNLDKSVFFTDIATIHKENPFRAIKFFIPKVHYDKLYLRKFKIGSGIEFRLFDEYNPNKITDILRFLIYLGQNSFKYPKGSLRKHFADDFGEDIIKKQLGGGKTNLVYHNKIWNLAIKKALQNGYKTIFSKEYVHALRNNTNLNINVKRYNSTHLLNQISKELFNKYKKGLFSRLMIKNNYTRPPIIINMNKKFIQYFTRKNRKKMKKKTRKKHH